MSINNQPTNLSINLFKMSPITSEKGVDEWDLFPTWSVAMESFVKLSKSTNPVEIRRPLSVEVLLLNLLSNINLWQPWKKSFRVLFLQMDTKIGGIISTTMREVERNGIIVRDGKTLHAELEIKKGMEFGCSYSFHSFLIPSTARNVDFMMS